MPKLAGDIKRINIYLSEEDLEYLRKQANTECSSVSLIVRRAVKEYIARNEYGGDEQ